MNRGDERDIPNKPSSDAVEQYRDRQERKPEAMEAGEMGNAGSVAGDSHVSSSPDVNLDGSMGPSEEERREARIERSKISLSLAGLRLKYLLARFAQVGGFALVFIGLYEMFGYVIEEGGGLSLNFLPKELIHQVYLQIGLHPVLLLVFGCVAIWLTTSTSR